MITCQKCKKQLEEGAKFCDNCGTKVTEIEYCHNCGKLVEAESAFCPHCGASLEVKGIIENEKKKRSFPIKKICFGGLIGACTIAAILVVVFLTARSKPNYGFYIKDEEIFGIETKKLEITQITKSFYEGETSIDSEQLFNVASWMGYYLKINEDGKLLFYIDKNGDSGGGTLYCRNLNKKEDEPIKIDSDVVSYSVNDRGECVTYIKLDGNKGLLYQHNLVDKEKIDSGVISYNVSDDGKKLVYRKSDDASLYYKCAGQDKEKIDRDVSTSQVTSDLSIVYYIKDKALYKKCVGEDKEKIASNVSTIIKAYDSGEIYYTKLSTIDINLKKYFEDDMEQADAAVSVPDYNNLPELPWRSDYMEKIYRDDLRLQLEEDSYISKEGYSLCYYDGSDETVITNTLSDNGYGYVYTTYAAQKPVVVFESYGCAPIKFSEINFESGRMISEDLLYSSKNYCLAIGDTYTVINEETAEDFSINSNGTSVYFLDNVAAGSTSGDLYRIDIVNGVAQSAELYNTDVSFQASYFVTDDKFKYYKNVSDSQGDLYINKDKIASAVTVYYDKYDEDSDSMLFFSDWDSDLLKGTLYIYKDNKSTKIADDVTAWTKTANGDILYLYDYSVTHYEGELYLYKDGKKQKIDDEVIGLIDISSSAYKGGDLYGW